MPLWRVEVPSSTHNLLVSEAFWKIALCLLLQLIIEVTNSVLLGGVSCLSSYSLTGFGLLICLCKPHMPFYTPVRIRGNNKDASIQGDILLVVLLYVTSWVRYIPGMQKQSLKISQSEKIPWIGMKSGHYHWLCFLRSTQCYFSNLDRIWLQWMNQTL